MVLSLEGLLIKIITLCITTKRKNQFILLFLSSNSPDICPKRPACGGSRCTRVCPPAGTRCICWSASVPTCWRTCPPRPCSFRPSEPASAATPASTGPSRPSRSSTVGGSNFGCQVREIFQFFLLLKSDFNFDESSFFLYVRITKKNKTPVETRG